MVVKFWSDSFFSFCAILQMVVIIEFLIECVLFLRICTYLRDAYYAHSNRDKIKLRVFWAAMLNLVINTPANQYPILTTTTLLLALSVVCLTWIEERIWPYQPVIIVNEIIEVRPAATEAAAAAGTKPRAPRAKVADITKVVDTPQLPAKKMRTSRAKVAAIAENVDNRSVYDAQPRSKLDEVD